MYKLINQINLMMFKMCADYSFIRLLNDISEDRLCLCHFREHV